MNIGNMTIKTDRIAMAVDFEAAFVHLSDCLIEVGSTCGISSIETELDIKVKNQEQQIATLI